MGTGRGGGWGRGAVAVDGGAGAGGGGGWGWDAVCGREAGQQADDSIREKWGSRVADGDGMRRALVGPLSLPCAFVVNARQYMTFAVRFNGGARQRDVNFLFFIPMNGKFKFL
jgi:hypothetical protein